MHAYPFPKGEDTMKKTLSLILALMMMLSCFGAFAEGESSGESGGDTMSAADVINMANSSANSEVWTGCFCSAGEND